MKKSAPPFRHCSRLKRSLLAVALASIGLCALDANASDAPNSAQSKSENAKYLCLPNSLAGYFWKDGKQIPVAVPNDLSQMIKFKWIIRPVTPEPEYLSISGMNISADITHTISRFGDETPGTPCFKDIAGLLVCHSHFLTAYIDQKKLRAQIYESGGYDAISDQGKNNERASFIAVVTCNPL